MPVSYIPSDQYISFTYIHCSLKMNVRKLMNKICGNMKMFTKFACSLKMNVNKWMNRKL